MSWNGGEDIPLVCAWASHHYSHVFCPDCISRGGIGDSETGGNCSLTQSAHSLPTSGSAPTSLLPLACAGAANRLNLCHIIKSLSSLIIASTLSLKIGTLCQAQQLSVLSPSSPISVEMEIVLLLFCMFWSWGALVRWGLIGSGSPLQLVRVLHNFTNPSCLSEDSSNSFFIQKKPGENSFQISDVLFS